jgi:hypothetical protein
MLLVPHAPPVPAPLPQPVRGKGACASGHLPHSGCRKSLLTIYSLPLRCPHPAVHCARCSDGPLTTVSSPSNKIAHAPHLKAQKPEPARHLVAALDLIIPTGGRRSGRQAIKGISCGGRPLFGGGWAPRRAEYPLATAVPTQELQQVQLGRPA